MLDVRSPGEFYRAHIPNAHNLPLFTDAERTVVGTLFKQQGRASATLQGLHYVGPRMAEMVETATSLAPRGHVRVHCWRGGERSRSVAWLLERAAMGEVNVLEGGYKRFRQGVQEAFHLPWPLHVLGGYTGTGKTELLSLLKAQGAQVIDLEALAKHRGSAFGALQQQAQPSTEHFENLLWAELQRWDTRRPIWVEDESNLIGRVKVPDAFFEQMRQAPLAFVEIPLVERVERLVADYGQEPKELLAEATQRIGRRLGPQHCKNALAALENNDLAAVATIALGYYDKAYSHGMSKRPPKHITTFPASARNLPELAARLHTHARSTTQRTGPPYAV
jgi:tRNA 2-selenouridine synthase